MMDKVEMGVLISPDLNLDNFKGRAIKLFQRKCIAEFINIRQSKMNYNIDIISKSRLAVKYGGN